MKIKGFIFQRIICYLVLLLSGCALPDKPTQPGYYDLGPAAAGTTVLAARPGLALPAMVLPEIETSAALERPGILYRLFYADAHALRAYTQAQWQAAPAQLVRQRLKSQLAQNRVVLAGSEPAALQAPVLQVELEAFSQQFDSPASSHGLVQLRATLSWVGVQGEKRVAQKSFSALRPAPSADAAGGVRALAVATDAVVADVDQWVQGVK